MKHSAPKKIVLIGASSGGPGQIKKILEALPILDNTSIVIAQHMADGFLRSFVSTLNRDKINQVEITQNNKLLVMNTIYVCEKSVIVEQNRSELVFKEQEHKKNSFNPNINMIFNSFVPLNEIKILSVILTGIGEDGIQACINLSNSGVTCITESSESAIIDGMPSRARELVPNIQAHKIDDIVKIVSEFCQ